MFAIYNPWNIGPNRLYSAFGFSVGLPIILYLLCIIGGVTIYISRPLSRRPLLLLCERLEGLKSDVFTMIASAIVLVVAIIVAFQKAVS
jgi:hypothetical protein